MKMFKLAVKHFHFIREDRLLTYSRMAEYGYNLDAFLDLISDTTHNSETMIATRDALYLAIIKCVLPHSVVHQNQSVPSSTNERHHFVVSISGALCLFGEQKICEQSAIAQLVSTIFVPEFRNVLPRGQQSVPGTASTSDSLAIYEVSLDDSNGRVVYRHVKSYNVNRLSDRVEFTIVIPGMCSIKCIFIVVYSRFAYSCLIV